MIQGDTNIDKHSFYCSSDSGYFNEWTKLLIASAKKHVPWANFHVHIFDPVESDFTWCKENEVTISHENTPPQYTSNIETKKGYWVNARFYRIPEIFKPEAIVCAIDSDSLFYKNMSQDEFVRKCSKSWVTVREKGTGSVGSGVNFGLDEFRNTFRNILEPSIEKDFKWYLDQEILDKCIAESKVNTFGMSFSDYNCRPESYIWTGKGTRKYKHKFAELANTYR